MTLLIPLAIITTAAIGCVTWNIIRQRHDTTRVITKTSERQLEDDAHVLGTVSDAATQAVDTLLQSVASYNSRLPLILSKSMPEMLDIFSARLESVLKANIQLQERLAAAEKHLRQQREDLNRASREARTDPLTSLPNRSGLQEHLADSLENPDAEKHTSTYFIMLDVDHFKHFNDQFGHAAGDRVLCAIADVLTDVVGAFGTVCRFGGDEFAAVLRCESHQQFAELMERFLEKVNETAAAKSDVPEHVSVSLGAALCNAPKDIDRSIDHADRALYRAKHLARNCAYFHDGERAVPLVSSNNRPVTAISTKTPLSQERRRSPRYPCELDYRIALPTLKSPEGGDMHRVSGIDVSSTGVAFRISKPATENKVFVELPVSGEQSVFLAHVVSCTPFDDEQWKVGCRLLQRVKPPELLFSHG